MILALYYQCCVDTCLRKTIHSKQWSICELLITAHQIARGAFLDMTWPVSLHISKLDRGAQGKKIAWLQNMGSFSKSAKQYARTLHNGTFQDHHDKTSIEQFIDQWYDFMLLICTLGQKVTEIVTINWCQGPYQSNETFLNVRPYEL